MPSYVDSSSILGSIMIIRRSRGDALKSTLMIMAFMDTDLPVPVAPAIRRCGIRARSATTTLPVVSLPSARVSFDSALR